MPLKQKCPLCCRRATDTPTVAPYHRLHPSDNSTRLALEAQSSHTLFFSVMRLLPCLLLPAAQSTRGRGHARLLSSPPTLHSYQPTHPRSPVIKPAWSHGRGSPSHPPISILSPSYTITRFGVGERLSTCPPCC